MEIALIVGFSLLLALAIAASVLVYSHYIYSKNRVFSKTKYATTWIVICSVLAVFMLVTGIMFTLGINYQDSLKYAAVYAGLSFACMSICLVYLVILLVMPKLTNKNKISYDNILSVDYDTKIKQLLDKIGDVDKAKAKLADKHLKYYQAMLSYYENILNRAKNSKLSKVEKLADIVTFNDAFTHKWSTVTNNYQLLLTYKFCQILQKIS
ncbi:MAG: hypothetical protein KBS35_01600 [Mycoplasma sp.]|nr:hypothetical protein [Candidatus Hennigella equi]